MSNYFDQIEQQLGAAVGRLAHKPWHVRLLRRRWRCRSLVLCAAVLAAATPAVGAVTHWFGFGASNHPPSDNNFGAVVPGSQRLLSLAVPDPQGGPPWGVRSVRTSAGLCLQVGRVQAGQLGTLGIDGYWHDDHRFHPFPRSWAGGGCSARGAIGAFGVGEQDASAGGSEAGCRSYRRAPGLAALCPPGSQRLIASGYLGSRVRSVTYREPDGALRTERTVGSRGEFLIVVQLNAAGCRLYEHGRLEPGGDCGDSPPRLDLFSALVSAYRYSTGVVCRSSAGQRGFACRRDS